VVTRALQTGEVFSPASGHAQVIAQGVGSLSGDVAWRAVFHSVDPGSTAEIPSGGPGFILVDTGGVVVDGGAALVVLAPTEGVFHSAPATRLTPIGDRPAGFFTIDLVPPAASGDAGGGIPVYASEPFPAPGGARDIDLVRDLLEPGESTTVIGNASPVLVLVTLGAVQAESSDGSTASLRVGEAATLNGDIVLTAEGQAPSTFVAAVIGREAPVPAVAGTPGATPAAAANVGSVQVTVYACPPLVGPQEANPGQCVRDPEAVALRLSAREGSSLRDMGPSGERQGLPTWSGLAPGEYVLQAVEFAPGFERFFVPGLPGTIDRGEDGFPAGEGGFRIPISGDVANYMLEVYAFAAADTGTPPAAATASPAVQTSAAETPVAETPAADAAPTSVILVETAVPGASPTATPPPRPTATPRPSPAVTATPRTVADSAIVTSTAVARPRNGSIDVRVYACPDSVETFDAANCAQAVEGFDIHLINEDGEIIGLAAATINPDGSISWEDLPLGSYLFQQPLLLPGTATYYAPALPLADDGSGYVITIGADEPVATVDMFDLPPSAVAEPTVAADDADSDLDGLLDTDEIGIYGTDPANADSDLDGILDGAEITAGTDPLVADAAPPVEPAADSDGDRLLDGDEAAFATDPANPDSDADGWFDGDEVNLGTDPLDASSFPVS
jgi:hypothetical protein